MAALQLVSSFELQNSVTGPEKKLEKAIDLAIDNKYYVTGIRNSQTSQCQNVLRDVTELIQCVFR